MTKHPSILPLKVENLEYEAGGKQLIKNISSEFNQGKRYLLLGPNGAGKTLLLRLCHGLLKPKSGKVIWSSGKDANPKHHQAMVTQRPVMLRRSAYANIDYALSVRGVEKSLRPDMINAVIQRTGLTRVANKLATVLSLGEQQRLAIARAWVLKPEVLFMDEPTASLDPPATHSIEELIHEISAEGTTVIMTCHDLGQAKRLATDVLFMFRGRIKEMSSADDFFAGPQNDLAQAFLDGQLIWWKRRPEKDDVQI
ncbi:ATP-binding cassette domain-containing protein [uncultured Kiloniella sp.]|uniref:ATP-binding cassette domain-containing protein n=1 Tax=uncultured Kiloniella sp. TaxID=1133091 RepID=UPI00261826C1|nr:ATP-binding cassette domain-containing protein [uncultured Kiloniella sp.]